MSDATKVGHSFISHCAITVAILGKRRYPYNNGSQHQVTPLVRPNSGHHKQLVCGKKVHLLWSNTSNTTFSTCVIRTLMSIVRGKLDRTANLTLYVIANIRRRARKFFSCPIANQNTSAGLHRRSIQKNRRHPPCMHCSNSCLYTCSSAVVFFMLTVCCDTLTALTPCFGKYCQ